MATPKVNASIRADFRRTIPAILLLLASFSARAADLASISDDSELRTSIELSVLRGPVKTVIAMKPSRRELDDGTSVELRIERGNGEFMIALAREDSGRFPIWTPGGWALYRRISDGTPTRIRVFLKIGRAHV